MWKSEFRQNSYRTSFSPTVPPFAARISRVVVDGGTWRVKWECLKAGESNGKLPPRTCPGCSVPEPFQSHDWALVPVKPSLQGWILMNEYKIMGSHSAFRRICSSGMWCCVTGLVVSLIWTYSSVAHLQCRIILLGLCNAWRWRYWGPLKCWNLWQNVTSQKNEFPDTKHTSQWILCLLDRASLW